MANNSSSDGKPKIDISYFAIGVSLSSFGFAMVLCVVSQWDYWITIISSLTLIAIGMGFIFKFIQVNNTITFEKIFGIVKMNWIKPRIKDCIQNPSKNVKCRMQKLLLTVMSLIMFSILFYFLIINAYFSLLFLVLITFFVVVSILSKMKFGLKNSEKINLILTSSIILLTFVQIWLGWYQLSAKMIGPVWTCPESISIDNTTKYEFSFGNYGQTIGYLQLHLKSENLMVYNSRDPRVSNEIYTKIPIPFIETNNNQQTLVTYYISVVDPTKPAKLSLKMIDLSGDSVIDSVILAPLREYLVIPLECGYKNINGTFVLQSFTRFVSP